MSFQKVILALSMLAMPLSAMAVSGDAKLDIGNIAGYDISLNDVVVEGETQTTGTGTGDTKLAFKNGEWSGMFGNSQITATQPKTDKKGRTTFRINVLPGGSYDFTVHMNKKGDRVEMSVFMPYGILGSVDVKTDSSELSGGHQYASLSLQENKKGYMDGYLYITPDQNHFGDSEYARLNATADLKPGALAVQDPVLFAILYFLPYSTFNY